MSEKTGRCHPLPRDVTSERTNAISNGAGLHSRSEVAGESADGNELSDRPSRKESSDYGSSYRSDWLEDLQQLFTPSSDTEKGEISNRAKCRCWKIQKASATGRAVPKKWEGHHVLPVSDSDALRGGDASSKPSEELAQWRHKDERMPGMILRDPNHIIVEAVSG